MDEHLNTEFDKLKEYSEKKEIEKLNKKIYSLNLPEAYLKSLAKPKLAYIHVKLHNALSYRHPFAPLEKIKPIHDIVAGLLGNHRKIDKLDEMFK